MIGGGTIVMKDVPPYAVVVGNPFRILRYRFDDSIIEALLKIEWWNWSPEVIASRVDSFYLPIEEFVAMYLPEVGTQPKPQPSVMPAISSPLPTVKTEFKLDSQTWKPTW